MQVEYMLMTPVLVALTVTIALIFALRPLAGRVGLVDRPGGRKLHGTIVPVVGGLAMFFGVFAGILIQDHSTFEFLSLVLASVLLLVTGVIDDRFSIHAVARIPVQIIVVLIMVYGGGFVLADMGDPFGTGIIQTGRFSLLFTLLVTIATINAFNYIDGVDGLAGSLGFIGFVSIALVAGPANSYSIEALTMAAAIVGFLVFNFPVRWNRRVRTFMGDAGSTLLGFSMVWIMIGVCQGPDRAISPVVGLWFAALPIFDFFTCFVRRIMKGKSPFTPGRDHVHHLLRRGGFTMRQRLAILAGIQVAYSAMGVAGHYAGVPDFVMFAAWSTCGVFQCQILRLVARSNRHRRMSHSLVLTSP